MLKKKKIREEMERDGIIELSMEYGLDIICFETDLYFKGVRKAISIKQRIQREAKNSTEVYLSLDEVETKNLYLILQEIFKDEKSSK